MVRERFSSLFTLVAIERFFRLAFQRNSQFLLALAATKGGAVFIGLLVGVITRFAFAGEAKVDHFAHYDGPSIFSGRTMASKSAAEMPSFSASSRKVVPFLCAVLAILAALS